MHVPRTRLHNEDVLVIGLGRFGGAIATELHRLGNRVTALELDPMLAETFLDFALKLAGKVPFVPDAVAMYYVMVDAKTPLKPRVLAAAALAYFVSPIDAIPDAIPVIGYLDDAAVVFYAMHLIHEHIKEEHVAAAQKLLRQETA